jgi:hypothetical protein
MRRSLTLILCITATLILSTSNYSQGAAAAGRLSDDAAGYSFVPPSGWLSNKGDEGFALVNPAKSVVISVRPHAYNDFASVARDTKFEADSEVVGEPRGLKNGGKSLRVSKRTPQGTGIIDFFVLFSPNGGGVLVMALSDTANSEMAFNAGSRLADSVAFSKPQQSAASGWQATLTGKHLLYLYSGNGYFEEKHIYLCSGGTFVQTTGSGGYTPGDADGGSFAGRGGKRGRWNVNGSTLILQFQDASVGRYSITQRQARNEIGLNGNRYFVKSDAGC